MAFCCCGAGGTATVSSKSNNEMRNLESIGLSRAPSPRLRRTEVQVPVTLNVYSLLESNKKLSKMGMGVFHTGVVVYGIEWGYGEVVENPNASGLFCVPPGQAAGTLYRTIRIGYTTRSPMQVDTILHRLENEWRSSEYHILHHNCNHFAQALCDLLSTTEKLQVPRWCNRAARVGDRVIPRKLATKVQHMMDDEPPKAVAPVPFSNVNEVPLSVVPREWYLHPSIFQPMRYVGGSQAESMLSHDNVPAAAHAGNGSHYTVEYDIVPPPGYEAPDTDSAYPPLMHREVFVATDENGSISRMTAIEERPSVSRGSRKTATRPLGGSAASTALMHSESPAPPPPLGAGVSTASADRVAVLPRLQSLASHPQSVAASRSPRMSVLTETESVLHSDGSEDTPPNAVRRHELPLASRSASAAATAAAAEEERQSLGAAAVRHANDRADAVVKLPAPRHRKGNESSRGGDSDEDAFNERPLHTVRETSMHSTSFGASSVLYGNLPSEPERPLVPPAPHQAQPVGCITTMPTALKEQKRRSRAQDENAATATDTASEAASETASQPRPDATPPRHREKGSTTARSKEERADTSHHGGGGSSSNASATKRRHHEFSAIATAPTTPERGSPNTSSATLDPKKKNPAWVFLLKARGITAGNSEGTKKAKKYLSTPPLSDAASQTDERRVLNLDTVSDTSSFPPSMDVATVQPRPTLDGSPSRHSAATTPTHLSDNAEAAPMVAESVSDSALDEPPAMEAVSVATPASPASPPTMAAVDGQSDAAAPRIPFDVPIADAAVAAATANAMLPATPEPRSGHGTPVSSGEGRRSPGLHRQNSPQPCCNSSTSSPAEQPLPRRLSESAVLPPSIAAADPRSPVAASVPGLEVQHADDAHSVRMAATPLHYTATTTPERVMGPAETTNSTSPATAHRHTRRGSSSAMDDTPTPTPPPAQRSRTPIPGALKGRPKHDNYLSADLVVAVGSHALEPPAARASSLSNPSLLPPHHAQRRCSSHAAGEAGTPVSPEKVAHTPMAPFPRRPSLLSREKAATASLKTPDASRSAFAAQRDLSADLKGSPSKSLTPVSSAQELDVA